MKRLIIAEKPSVAKDFGKALGSFKANKQGFLENSEYIIASALGHLVELYMPEDFDAKYKYWTLKNLPILPEQFLLKPIKKTEDKFAFLKKLMWRDDVGEVINACDAGREGELIFSHLYELAGCEKPVKRLWLSSMTDSAIRSAFADLRSHESMDNLRAAAKCRSESDWLVGINGTRAVTGRLIGSKRREVASVGRVQTPTLALVYEREKAIKDFKEVPFWRIKGNFEIKNGVYEGWLQREDFDKKNKSDDDRADRFWEEESVKTIADELNKRLNELADVKETTKSTKQSPPKLFDLTTLQRECNQRFGMSAKHTLDVAQALYERHKVLTYPRTDSKALPEDYCGVCESILTKLSSEYKPFANKILSNNWINPSQKTIFNNKAVSDHFAIIPTEKQPDTLKPDEQKVYDFVVTRFLSVFFPPAEFAVTTRLTNIAHFSFKTEGKVLVSPGWLEVVKRTDTKESLPALAEEDKNKAVMTAIESFSETTKPPARFTEATLLASMERAGQFVEDDELAEAMKEKGLGTPATRAQIIEHLIASKYLERAAKELLPTSKAWQLFEFLDTVKVQELSSPTLTGEWEYRLKLIQDGKLSRTQFMTDIRLMTSKIVDSIISFKDSESDGKPTEIISPSDGLPMIETFRNFKSQDGKVSIFKTIGNRKMEEFEIAQLIKDGKIGPINDFKSKLGRPFSAMLELTDDYKVKFVFDAQNEHHIQQAEALKEYPIVGDCPICKAGKVHATESVCVCSNSKAENPCKFRIARILLNRTISDEQFEKLIKTGKTDLIDKFKSKRTGKYFSAYITLSETGEIGFEFSKKAADAKTTAGK